MEKNLRVRVVHRLLFLPPAGSTPVRVGVNCWRVCFVFNAAIPPIIDGVNYEFFGTNSPGQRINAPITITQGGVYDCDGLPVYLNQVFQMASSAAEQCGVLLIEEYIDHDARQNR
jgi:hypothetical protein